ncbi:MAG: tetratricopeptide repeat protein, partial [Planctomycetota bacterium]
FMVDRMVDRLDASMGRAGIDEDAIIDAIDAMRASARSFNPADVATDLLIAHIVEPTQRALPAIGDDPKTMAYLQEFVRQTFGNLGRLAEAEQAYVVAVDLWTSIEPPEATNRRRAKANFAEILLQLSRTDEAIEILGELVEVGRGPAGGLDEQSLQAQNSLAAALVSEDRYEEASKAFREALEGFRALAADGSDVAAARAETIETNLGAVLVLQGELEEARPLLESAIEGMRARPDAAENLDQVLVNLGRLEFASGDFPAAIEAFEEATKAARRRFGREHVRSAAAGHELAQLNFQLGRYAEAIPLLEEVVSTRRRLLGPTSAPTLQTGLYLPLAHLKTGDLDAAIATRDRFDSDFIAAGDEIGPNRLQMLYFFMQFANDLGTVAGEREATFALERLHDSCIAAPPEISGGPICSDVMRFLPLFYDAMIESEPEADWASRRSERFGS